MATSNIGRCDNCDTHPAVHYDNGQGSQRIAEGTFCCRCANHYPDHCDAYEEYAEDLAREKRAAGRG